MSKAQKDESPALVADDPSKLLEICDAAEQLADSVERNLPPGTHEVLGAQQREIAERAKRLENALNPHHFKWKQPSRCVFDPGMYDISVRTDLNTIRDAFDNILIVFDWTRIATWPNVYPFFPAGHSDWPDGDVDAKDIQQLRQRAAFLRKIAEPAATVRLAGALRGILPYVDYANMLPQAEPSILWDIVDVDQNDGKITFKPHVPIEKVVSAAATDVLRFLDNLKPVLLKLHQHRQCSPAQPVSDQWDKRSADPSHERDIPLIRLGIAVGANLRFPIKVLLQAAQLLGEAGGNAAATLRLLNLRLNRDAAPLTPAELDDGRVKQALNDLVMVAEKSATGSTKTQPDTSQSPAPRHPLGKNALTLYQKLCSLPEAQAMNTRQIMGWFAENRNFIDTKTIGEITKELKPYGIQNKPRIGYYIPLGERPEKTS